MDIEDLFEIYADINNMTYKEVENAWDKGFIYKFDLLNAWLENEGIIGYNFIMRDLFELLEEL